MFFCLSLLFPEGELPHSSDFFDDFSDKWYLEDIQNIGMSYYKTLLEWKNNLSNWNGLDKYDKKFRRIWNYYLLHFSLTFKYKDFMLYQLVYTKKNNNIMNNCNHIRIYNNELEL